MITHVSRCNVMTVLNCQNQPNNLPNFVFSNFKVTSTSIQKFPTDHLTKKISIHRPTHLPWIGSTNSPRVRQINPITIAAGGHDRADATPGSLILYRVLSSSNYDVSCYTCLIFEEMSLSTRFPTPQSICATWFKINTRGDYSPASSLGSQTRSVIVDATPKTPNITTRLSNTFWTVVVDVFVVAVIGSHEKGGHHRPETGLRTVFHFRWNYR